MTAREEEEVWRSGKGWREWPDRGVSFRENTLAVFMWVPQEQPLRFIWKAILGNTEK